MTKVTHGSPDKLEVLAQTMFHILDTEPPVEEPDLRQAQHLQASVCQATQLVEEGVLCTSSYLGHQGQLVQDTAQATSLTQTSARPFLAPGPRRAQELSLEGDGDIEQPGTNY